MYYPLSRLSFPLDRRDKCAQKKKRERNGVRKILAADKSGIVIFYFWAVQLCACKCAKTPLFLSPGFLILITIVFQTQNRRRRGHNNNLCPSIYSARALSLCYENLKRSSARDPKVFYRGRWCVNNRIFEIITASARKPTAFSPWNRRCEAR